MSDVIDLLEILGQDARTFQDSDAVLVRESGDSQAARLIQAAIATGDSRPLQASVDAGRIAFCGVFPAKEDEDDEEPDETPDDADEIRCGVLIVR